MQKQMARASVPAPALTPHVLRILRGAVARLAKPVKRLQWLHLALKTFRVGSSS